MRRLRRNGRVTARDADIRAGVPRDSCIGSIRLDLPRTSFSAGDVITGTLLLSISTPVRARGLFAILSAYQQCRKLTGDDGEVVLRTTTRELYRYQHQLDGEREYFRTPGTVAYPFSLVMPPVLSSLKDSAGRNDGSGSAPGMPGNGTLPCGPVEWSVEGYLDLPLAYDVRERVRLSVREEG